MVFFLTYLFQILNYFLAFCNYCSSQFTSTSSSGTSNLLRHINVCSAYKAASKEGNVNYSRNNSTELLVKMMVQHGYPPAMVEDAGFVAFVSSLHPDYVLPSKSVTEGMCLKKSENLKVKLRAEMQKHDSKFSFTASTWTSPQGDTFVSLAANWVDPDWKFQNKLLSVKSYSSTPTGEEISESLFQILQDWNISQKILSFTLNRGLFESTTITSLARKLKINNGIFHHQSATDILNMIIQPGLLKFSDSINHVRNFIAFTKDNSSRREEFIQAAKRHEIDIEFQLTLDSPLKWETTYLMLKNILQYKIVLDSFTMVGSSFPAISIDDWEAISSLCTFLDVFHQWTLKFSDNTHITAPIFLKGLANMHTNIGNILHSGDTIAIDLYTIIKPKFDEHWYDFSPLLAMATVLDPRCKFAFVTYSLGKFMSVDDAKKQTEKTRQTLQSLYQVYSTSDKNTSEQQRTSGTAAGGASSSSSDSTDEWGDFEAYLESSGSTHSYQTEILSYLYSPRVSFDDSSFDILEWWKSKVSDYPILSKIAKDILSVQITSAGSDSVFSKAEILLSEDMSKIDAKAMEAIACAQNWSG